MEGAALTTPFEEDPLLVEKKTRNRRKKGDAPERASRRCRGEEPSVLDEVPDSCALKKLRTGGSGKVERKEQSNVQLEF